MKKGHKKEIKKIFSTLIAVIIMAAMGFLQLMSDAHVVYAAYTDGRTKTGGMSDPTAKNNENDVLNAKPYGTGDNVITSVENVSGVYQHANYYWTTATMPKYAMETLPYNSATPYIDLFQEGFVWAL